MILEMLQCLPRLHTIRGGIHVVTGADQHHLAQPAQLILIVDVKNARALLGAGQPFRLAIGQPGNISPDLGVVGIGSGLY
jgi:hypothetical protein